MPSLGFRRRKLGWFFSLASLAVLTAWLSAALGRAWPTAFNRLLILAWIAGGVLLLVRWIRQTWAGDARWSGGRVLLTLLAISLLVRWLGVPHEVGEGSYLDEGTYISRALKVNDGEVLQMRFAYPHFLYYLYAFVFWLAQQFWGLVQAVSGLLFGLTDPSPVRRLLARFAAAGIATLAVWPAWRIAERLAGRIAGWAGGLLIVAAPLFNSDAHLLISDVPAATFAGLCLLPLIGLREEETHRRYAASGILAGLAAATKYPAGTVALAIVGSWAAARFRRRDLPHRRPWHWGLFTAAAAAMLTFLAVMPSLVVYWRHAWTSDQGLLFGLRQYGGGGWFGVVRRSDALFYLGRLIENWGIVALVGGAVGCVLIAAQSRRRGMFFEWLVFPLAYFVLIAAMTMSVTRNLDPLLPPLAGLLGAGLAVLAQRLASILAARAQNVPSGEKRVRAAAWMKVMVPALALVPPIAATALQTVSLCRPGTRVVAREWIEANVPPGATILAEHYTPTFFSGRQRVIVARRFLPTWEFERMQREGVQYLLLSNGAYGRFFNDDLVRTNDWPVTYRAAYETIFREFELVAEWQPSAVRDGPKVSLYRTPWARVP
jgi:hypothetical protein